MPSPLKICLLPGDGIGPEVVDAAVEVLAAAGQRFGFALAPSLHPIGGAAVRASGSPLPEATRAAVAASQAVLLGAVGAPEFDAEPPARKPETGLLALRRQMGCWANLRPVRRLPGAGLVPLREEVVAGTDLIVLRELTGGLYFGEPRGFAPDRQAAFNTLRYSVEEIERLARFGFALARRRRRRLTSVDKANVLETSQLWRQVFQRVAADFPDVQLDHLYVDNCAMQLMLRPASFDVLATENLFGDILSDEAGVLAGSLGLLPSASLGGPIGLYEPVHGSAPDIAGKGWANPLGAILSAAMMLRHSFPWEPAAAAIERAAEATLRAGVLPRDLVAAGARFASTAECTRAVIQHLAA
ncbi:MAG TPA: 3-isopropylmalate dehydrogenase [Terriglobales bacterium]|nr:3-isopropylmalate dehydrogenase [Terriglobales bacterium]